jgi:hypothetical protein
MGEWITGAAINVVGSISINFGTNLLKLGHNQVILFNLSILQSCAIRVFVNLWCLMPSVCLYMMVCWLRGSLNLTVISYLLIYPLSPM